MEFADQDKNGDGLATKEEIKKWYKYLGNPMPEDDLVLRFD